MTIITMVVACTDPVDYTDENSSINGLSFIDEQLIVDEGLLHIRDEVRHNVTLWQDDDVYLTIGQAQVKLDHVELQKDQHSLKTVGPMAIISAQQLGARGIHTIFDVYTYEDQRIKHIFSSSEMTCTIEAIHLDLSEVKIRLPLSDSISTYKLNDKEKEQTDERIAELEQHQVAIDDDLIKESANNLFCIPINIAFADVQGDEQEELLVLTELRTTGSKTPVHIYSQAVLVYGIEEDSLKFIEVEFDWNQASEASELLRYFPDAHERS